MSSLLTKDFTDNDEKRDASLVVLVVLLALVPVEIEGNYLGLVPLMSRGTSRPCQHWQRTSCSGSNLLCVLCYGSCVYYTHIHHNRGHLRADLCPVLVSSLPRCLPSLVPGSPDHLTVLLVNTITWD